MPVIERSGRLLVAMCRLTMAPHLAPCGTVLAASRPVAYVGPWSGTPVSRETLRWAGSAAGGIRLNGGVRSDPADVARLALSACRTQIGLQQPPVPGGRPRQPRSISS